MVLMPVINFSYSDLIGLLGQHIPMEKLIEDIPSIGADMDKVEGDRFSVEFFPDRPDLFSVEGIARALRLYLGIDPEPRPYPPPEPSGVRMAVDPSVRRVRPYIACAVVKDLRFTDDSIRSLMDIQEKLHSTLGRKRVKVAIGVHDLAPLRPPFRYWGTEPDGTPFVPLGSTETMTPAGILVRHEKGKAYASILEGHSRYPIITDSLDQVLSFPPVINGELTAVKETTRELFIDMTGTDMLAVSRTLNILTTSLMERGAKVLSVDVTYPGNYLPDDKGHHVARTLTTPDFSPSMIDVDLAGAAAILGLPMETDWRALAGKMGFVPVKEISENDESEWDGEEKIGGERSEEEKARGKREMEEKIGGEKGAKLRLLVPPYRSDILHPMDIVEDLAIAYGYLNFSPCLPAKITFGNRLHTGDEKLRVKMVGLGFNEVCTLTLSSIADQSAGTGEPGPDDEMVIVENPITIEHDCLRLSLVPSLLNILRANRHRDTPQRIFELGYVVRSGKNEKRLACAITHPRAGYTEMKAIVENINGSQGFTPSGSGRYIPGRGAEFPGGSFGELHPRVVRHFSLDYPVTVLEQLVD